MRLQQVSGLEDRKTGQWLNLWKEQPYTFWTDEEAAVIKDRFFVHVNVESVDQPQTSTGINADETNMEVFAINSSIMVRSDQSMNGRLDVINLLGQLVYQRFLDGATQQTITLDLATGSYIVSYHGDTEVINSRIYIAK